MYYVCLTRMELDHKDRVVWVRALPVAAFRSWRKAYAKCRELRPSGETINGLRYEYGVFTHKEMLEANR